MRHICRFVPVALLSLALSACFLSEAPLVTAESAVFPVERLTFKGDGEDVQTLERIGDAYRVGPPDKNGKYALLRLAAAGDDAYVAELWAPDSGDDAVALHAFLVVDPAADRIASYASLRPQGFQPVAGISACESNACVADLDAYVAYAQARVATGVPPDTVYTIVSRD